MARQIVNLAASVRQRLMNLAVEPHQFSQILETFVFERLLYRLSTSQYRNQFILKGGMLVMLWVPGIGRFTRDLDFHAFGIKDNAELRKAFADILAIDAEDGLVFDAANIGSEPILKDDIYGGTRLRTMSYLGKTRIPISIDLGFGFASIEKNYEIVYESLLDFPPASIRAYSPASVIAEKFHAIVVLAEYNTRIKDFFDLAILPQKINVENKELEDSIRATFVRRATIVPTSRPAGLSEIFWRNPERIAQWERYVKDTDLAGCDLSAVSENIWAWLGPICSKVIASNAEAK